MSALEATRTKLSAARTRLILERPFIGALVMHLPLRAADPAWCETVATDARALYFNPRYVADLDFGEAQFVLAHEALHCALGHFARRGHRVKARWDVATDHAVNLLLADEGLKSPPGALANRAFHGLSAEEIYPLIALDTKEQTLDRHIADDLPMEGAGRPWQGSAPLTVGRLAAQDSEEAGETGDAWDDAGNEARLYPARIPPAGLKPGDRDTLAAQWQSRLALAAQQARQAGRLSGFWMRLIEELIQPQLPWRMLLARYVMSIARDDYSYERLSRRDGDALLPRLASGNADLCVALDTSGSVSDSELSGFAAEVDALKGQIRACVTLLACDERLDERAPWRFEAWEPVVVPQALGGGAGTSFVPVFEWIACAHYRPDLLVYFTDAEGNFPTAAPDFPVVWLVKGRAPVPWGERIQLN